ncbi:MAG: mechanosensitive ion channel domain-containing protein [Bdellovibrionia bacterium]
MNTSARATWIPLDRVSGIVQLEPALILLLLALGAFFFYRIFLKAVSRERHDNIRNLFFNLSFHFIFGTFFFVSFSLLQMVESPPEAVERAIPYLGLVSLISGAIILVKISRILIFEYLFIGHMKEGVPLLLVNIFSLLLSVTLAAWIASEVFSVRLTPVLATSAVFSVVLGLALQDTLGNLFAGVALQLDKPYEIGDWVEIETGGKKQVGQVLEISWRSTVLLAFTDELITIPNRTMSQAQVSNFSPNGRPIVRSLQFRVNYGSNLELAKQLLVQSTVEVSQILKLPEPIALISEATDSWVTLKLIYYIHNYGGQYTVADEVYKRVIKFFNEKKIEFAPNRIAVETQRAA